MKENNFKGRMTMMQRAFLSHTGMEKDFVHSVANRLKRSNVIFDVYNFEAGIDFRKSIRDGLDTANMYVLFASRNALESIWVNFELDEAEIRYIEGKIQKFLVFTIGNDISHTDLPTWLRRALVIPAPGAAQCARLIHENLIKDNQQKLKLFLGREEELRSFSESIAEYGMNLPQVISFSGLEGVGRKTFAEFALKQNLLQEIGPIFEYNSSSGLEDLYLDLMDENMELSTREDMAKSIALFRETPINEQAWEIARLISLFSHYNVTPVIIDKGAFLTERGTYIEPFAQVMECLKEYPESSVILIQTRYPQLAMEPLQKRLVFTFRVRPLSLESTTRLLQIYLRNAGIIATSEQVSEVASYLDGYPPAVIFATAFVKEYGMEALVADKTLLTDFKVRAFTEFLEKMQLNDEQKEILRILAGVPPIGFAVLLCIVDKMPEQVSRNIRFLVDSNLVLSTQGSYTIATPVKDAVWRKWGNLGQKEFALLAQRVKSKFWDVSNLPDIETIELLIFSLLRANNDDELNEFSGIIMPSTLLEAAKAAYNNREWKRAKQLAKQVLQLDSDKDDARVILYKSLVRENEDAEGVLSELRERHHKSVFYLSGFRAWKNGEYREAAKHYHDAIRSGDESNSVYRELAECQYWIGDLEGAQRSISVVLERGKPNPFVLDLAAKIHTDLGNYDLAEDYITKQQLVDRAENVAHRKAALFAAKGIYPKALEYATEACTRIPPLPESYFLRARILIELGSLSEAGKALDDMQQSFRGIKMNIQLGLRCKLLLKKNDWRQAEIVYERLHNKNNPVNRGIRVQILRLKIQDIRLGILEKTSAQQELVALEKQRLQDVFEIKSAFEPVIDEGN